ncbi:IclR family transcriptional regulator [Parapusillimonas granuli]|uniref:Helix-turn-helix domain-containing protein n=1 Tax=Parapusillimonas granuli TaxID=380911 RepID=A0A853FY78_9BURK|nr:helix-turn-helix domain-containing protein [Parapusillimonas granuli]MBB5214545.1 DNA-binding IclR family transcriptional regulator [Parapusillimonas granuli]NYT49047.1 helix-turn-helix domain-containing protein [Parapusillimonas granuli]
MRRRTAEPNPPMLGLEAAGGGQVNSLQRGLDILHLFNGREPMLTHAEIAGRLGLPRATASKLIATLVAANFLRQDVNGAYGPDVACLALGRAVKRGLPVVQAASPQMLRFAEEFGVHVSLMTRERLQMLVLEHAVPSGLSHLGLATGALVPMARSASGRAFLWAQKPGLQAELFEALKDAGAEGAHRFMPGVYAAFQELEERGFCFMASPVTRQTSSVATPLYDRGAPAYSLAAMSLGGSDRERELIEEIGPRLLQVSAEISRDLERLPA